MRSIVLLASVLAAVAPARAAGPVGLALGGYAGKLPNATALKRALLEDYEMSVPPPGPPGSERGVLVSVQMALNQLVQVDTTTEEIQFYAWWRHNWVDPRLQWRPEDWGGVWELTFVSVGEYKEVWIPDDLVYEAVKSEYEAPDLLVNVYSDGSVFVSVPIATTLPCPMKLKDFPFDEQHCKFTFASWTSNAFEIDTQPRYDLGGKPVPIAFTKDYHRNQEFDLVKIKSHHFDSVYACCDEPPSHSAGTEGPFAALSGHSCCNEPYPVITFEMSVRRHPTTYFYGILLPMILTTLAGFLAFAANPDSGERIGLGITCLLTSAAIYIVAFEVLPKTGQMTMITEVHVISFCFSWATLAVSVVSVSLYAVKASGGPMSEHELMMAFVRADKDNSGTLEKGEVEEALKKLGLEPSVTDRLRKDLASVGDVVTLPVWYDLVAEVHTTDGLAAYHSPLVGRLLGPFIKREHEKRKATVLRRVEAAIARNALSSKVLSATHTRSRDGVRRRRTTGGGRALLGHLGLAHQASNTSVSNAPPGDSLGRSMSASYAPARVYDDGSTQQVDGDGSSQQPGADVESPRRPSGGRASIHTMPDPAANVRLEDLVTEHELRDPSEIIARKVAGYIDLAAMIVLPLAYVITIIVLLSPYNINAHASFDGTRFVHVTPDGDTTVECCYGRGPAP